LRERVGVAEVGESRRGWGAAATLPR